jgi:hypothetical protein
MTGACPFTGVFMTRVFVAFFFALILSAGTFAAPSKEQPKVDSKLHTHSKKCPVQKYQRFNESKTTRQIYGEEGNFKGSASIASSSRPLSTF